MKKLILLTLSSFLFACSSGGDGSDNSLNFDCPDFDGSTSQSVARQKAVSYDSEEYNLYVLSYGQPIDEGYFVYDYGDGTYDYSYIFLFANGDDRYGYEVTNYCVTYGSPDSASCPNAAGMDTIEDLFPDDICDNIPFGIPEDYTRIY